MNNELKKNLEGNGGDLIEVLSQYWLEGLRKTTKPCVRKAGIQRDVQAEHLEKTNLKRYYELRHRAQNIRVMARTT
jgi:hypothetical protein